MSASGREWELLSVERDLWAGGFGRVMGLDEAGRGCLCGPVVAAGVVLRPGCAIDGVDDSKRLSAHMREQVGEQIKREALFWAVCELPPVEIDRLNILKASLAAMELCTEAPGAEPDYLLVDGNRFLPSLTPHRCLVGGDARSMSIAAASILAKVHRDRIMITLDRAYPGYDWARNKGYPTAAHYHGIRLQGVTPVHRRSFRLEPKEESQR